MRLPVRLAAAGSAFLLVGAVAAQEKPPPKVGGQYQATAQQPEVKTITRIQPPVKTTEAAPQPMGYESNVYCFGYVGAAREPFPFVTIGAESLIEQNDFITGDLMYLDGGVDRGLKEGDEFWLVTEPAFISIEAALRCCRFRRVRPRSASPLRAATSRWARHSSPSSRSQFHSPARHRPPSRGICLPERPPATSSDRWIRSSRSDRIPP